MTCAILNRLTFPETTVSVCGCSDAREGEQAYPLVLKAVATVDVRLRIRVLTD